MVDVRTGRATTLTTASKRDILCLATVAGPLVQIREETDESITLQPFYKTHRRFLRELNHAGAELSFGICSDEAQSLVDEFITLGLEKGKLFRKRNDERIYLEAGLIRWCREEYLDTIERHTRLMIEKKLPAFYEHYCNALTERTSRLTEV